MADATRILQALEHGEPGAAGQLLSLAYDELRQLASRRMSQEKAAHTLQPTALVHEAWLRLTSGTEQKWENRAHFFAAAGEAMRRILIERARRRQRIRHGGGQERVDIEEIEIATADTDETLLKIHEALNALAAEDPIKAEVVKLRYFIGMSDREVAEALGISERSVERYWAYAKVWLFREMRTQG